MDNVTGVIISGVVVWFIVLFSIISYQRSKVEEKRIAYEDSLQELRNRPTNPDLHEKTLRTGRAYANATRNKTGVTLFDETALANDIRAATANASQSVRQERVPVRVKSKAETIDERIAALQKLRAAGMLSDEEFEQKRKDILDSI